MKPIVNVISAQGDLDMRECRTVGKAIDELIEHQQTKIVVECSRADWIDPLALGIFLAQHRQLFDLGGALKFAATNPMIRGLFSKYGVDKFIEDYEHVEDAVISFDEDWGDSGTSH